MKLLPRSKISCSRSVLLVRPSWRMGTLAASYFRMFAGNMPGGIWRSDVFIVARDLRERHVDVHIRVEIDADDGVSVVRLRLDMFDVVDVGGEAAFERRENALLHLVGREAVVGVQRR